MSMSRIVLWSVATCLLIVSQTATGPHTSAAGHRNEGERSNPRRLCYTVDSPGRIICACTEQICDDLKFDWPTERLEPQLVESSEAGLRFDVSCLSRTRQAGSGKRVGEGASIAIEVNLAEEHQEILGWGGAFTDASGINVNSLRHGMDEKLLSAYFGPHGLHYNFGRVPIGGSDFSTHPYTYDATDKAGKEQTADYGLDRWALAPEDYEYKIPLIKRAAKMAASGTNETLKLIGSPWSPPNWMKDNHNVTRGHLIDDEAIYRSYAEYHVRFYLAYAEQGIEFWGGTVQNEPITCYFPTYIFNSLQMGTAQTIKFIEHLGPLLGANGFTRDKFKLMIGDDNLGMIDTQVYDLMANEQVAKYVSGLAYHWYYSGRLVSWDLLSDMLSEIKDKIDYTIMTEACTGVDLPPGTQVDMGSWARGEEYARDIIEDLLRQTNAWIDWNIALDQRGGPNWVNNFVDSPIIVNSQKNEFYKQPMYYVLAHFSRFFRPGSKRVTSSINGSVKLGAAADGNSFQGDEVLAVAALDKANGRLAVNILNRAIGKRTIEVTIKNVSTATNSRFVVPPFVVDGKSMNTLIMKV